jgi:signal transduction histidine kinase
VIGAFYLTNKKGAREFSDADEALIERFAAHAAVIVENARLFEKSRELSVVEERNRLARDLHDSVNQTLFSLNLTAEAATALITRDPIAAEQHIRRVGELAQSALREMRALVFELRPAVLEEEGLGATLRKHVDVVRRAYGVDIHLDIVEDRWLPVEIASGMFRIIQEALNNALKHANARSICISLAVDTGSVCAEIRDDGVGFDPQALPARARHLGLTSMEERCQRLDGRLELTSAPGRGTAVRVELRS